MQTREGGARESELLGESCLLQDRIRGVTGENLAVDGEPSVRHRTPPDLVIALALAIESATRVQEDSFQSRREVRH
jgi:hypothetical protein